MPRKSRCKWTFTLEVADCWVADGFKPSAETIKDALLSGLLGYAREDEVSVVLVREPTDAQLSATIDRAD